MSRSANTVNTLIHLYRAEVGRLTAYRTRLDTTTNWAISSSALVSTLAFGAAEMSHAALLFLLFLNYFFLHLEARRFRHYETSRYRAHLFEQLLLPEVTGDTLEEEQERELHASLQKLPPAVSRLGAIAWRLRRTYLWIYSGVVLAWVAKLNVSGVPTLDPLELARRADVGSFPGWAIGCAVLVSYVWLLGLALFAARLYPLGDDEVRELVSNVPD